MVVSRQVRIETRGCGDAVDITESVAEQVRASGLGSGVATLFVESSTSALTTMEFEPGVVWDLGELLGRIAPVGADYRHNLRWGDGNGHAHIRHALIGPSLVVPFVGGRLTLGTWQQVVLLEFDNRPRSRSVVVQLLGE